MARARAREPLTRAEDGGDRPLPAGLDPGGAFDPAWCLVVDDDRGDADLDRVAEAWCCLADGTVGTRAVLEEAADPGSPVVAAGLYEPAEGVGEALLPLPSWCGLPLVEDLPRGRRVLDLRDGVLTREARAGDRTLLTARFACAQRPGTGVLVAEAHPGLLSGDPAVPDPHSDPGRWTSPFGGGAVATSDTRVSGGGPAGAPITIERVAVHVVSPRQTPRRASAASRLARAVESGPAGLLAEQRRAWARRWAHADIEIPGDPETTFAARFSLFHLLSSVARRGEAAVGARGLTGPAYAGHVFWDADVFVLPVLAAVDPRAARAMLEYRLRRLDAAKARAAANWTEGARFPWESAHDGSDVTPRWGIDQRGNRVPIRTGDLEAHVTADVAWAAWRYEAWNGDWSFLDGAGAPLLVETARYWADRVRWDDHETAHIDHVIGPDEYHEDVDDNAFTNVMARWNLRRAAELVERSGLGGCEAEEAEEWLRTADGLVDGLDPATGRYEQFAGYDRLETVMVADLGTPPLPAELVLGHERLAGSQVIKQADVLMAHLLVPGEVVPGSLEANLEHYLPRCAHGSTLSPSVHATLLARAGRTAEALDLLGTAVAVDLEDLTETTAGGLHLANLGGIWQALVHGFAGVAVEGPDQPALVVDPRLPDGWDELRVAIRWHGTPLRLVCRHDAVHVASPAPLIVQVHGTLAGIEPPGGWVG